MSYETNLTDSQWEIVAEILEVKKSENWMMVLSSKCEYNGALDLAD
jgi:hypothetical protein